MLYTSSKNQTVFSVDESASDLDSLLLSPISGLICEKGFSHSHSSLWKQLYVPSIWFLDKFAYGDNKVYHIVLYILLYRLVTHK